MELSDIRITKKNHRQHNIECGGGDFYKGSPASVALELNNDINKYFDEVFNSSSVDWGGKYATWLNNLGIPNETDNGWWSLAAIAPENIQAFIRDYTDETDEYTERIENVMKAIRLMKKTHNVTAKINIVDKLLEAFEEAL